MPAAYSLLVLLVVWNENEISAPAIIQDNTKDFPENKSWLKIFNTLEGQVLWSAVAN